MNLGSKCVVLGVALLGFGAARMRFEDGLTRDLREARLLPQSLQVDTMDRIGQTSAAVALGGLRTLVATFLNLRAFTFFTEKRWNDVEQTFHTIVALAPNTRYYWDTGYWHMAYNAASYYIHAPDLSPVRRREAWRGSIVRGRAFLERGIRNNPDDWSLLSNLGYLLTDSNKFPAFKNRNETFAAAADAYQRAAATGKALGYVRRFQLYALARVEGREEEALVLARSLNAEGMKNRTPTFQCVLFAMEAHHNPDADLEDLAVKCFGSHQKAYDSLSQYWQRTSECLPVFGVAKTLAALENRLSLPEEKRVLNKPLPPPRDVDQWFRH